MSESKFAERTKLGRASRTLGQLWQVPTFLAGVLVFAVVAVSAPWRQDSTSAEFDGDLNRLRAGLTQKRDKLDNLTTLADTVLARVPRYPHKAAEAHLLAGVLYDRLAEGLPADKAAAMQKRALVHLEEALARGVAEADQPHLFFRLGRLLYQKSELRRAIQLVARSVDQQPLDQRPAAYGMLVHAYLKLPRPDVDAAIDANQKRLDLLEDEKSLAEGWLLQGDLLARKDRRLEALKMLERVGARAPRDLRVPARLLQIRCCEHEGLWNKAIALWTELMPEAVHIPRGRGRVLYALGWCHVNLEPPDYKLAHRWWDEASGAGGDEGQAANFRLAELRLFGPAADPAAALPHLAKALGKVSGPAEYHNNIFTLKHVRELFDQALEKHGADLKNAQELAELYQRVALPGVAQERLARAAEELARRLSVQAEQAAKAGKSDARKLQEQARAQFRRAAEAYEQAAETLAENQRGDAWWRSAGCYLPDKAFAKAAVALEKFVKTKASDEQIAEAYLVLAEAYRELGDARRATEAYFSCIAIPNTPFAARALYQLALFHMAQSQWEEAEHTLRQVLGISTGVDRETQELALFKLAELLLQRKDYDKARLSLEQAIQQYPHNPQVWRMREQLGDCYLRLAEGFKQRMDNKPSELQYRRNRSFWLERARQTCEHLADDLQRYATEATAQGKPLSSAKATDIRRANLMVAYVYFELDLHEEALRRYEKLWQDYRRQAEGFVACHHLYLCVRLISNRVPPEEANRLWNTVRNAVRDVLTDLQEMPETDPAFARTPRERWLSDFNAIMNRLPRPTAPAPMPLPPS